METTEREKLARLIRGGRWAALATYGDGVPLASMVAYACEPGFAGFLLHLSRLSAHTRNLLASPSASIVISETDTAQIRDPQTLGRVSIQGEARPIREDLKGYPEAKALYEKRFPIRPPSSDSKISCCSALSPGRPASLRDLPGPTPSTRRN